MGSRIRRAICLAVFTALLVVVSSCVFPNFTQSKKMAEVAVEQFHGYYNAGQFSEVYSQTAKEFKTLHSDTEIASFLELLRLKLGLVKLANQINWRVKATTSGTTVTLDYDVEFSNGKAIEEFVFQLEDSKAMLLGYEVESPLLSTK